MRVGKETASSSLSVPSGSYIYSIKPLSNHLVASCSDNTLRLFDGQLALQSTIQTKSASSIAGSDLTCLDTDGSHLAFTAGTDGNFAIWDARDPQKASAASKVSEPRRPVASIAACGNKLAVGTELAAHAAVVSVWDLRRPDAPFLRFDESHNDDVTELCWSPLSGSGGGAEGHEGRYLLSGGTDALINIYDTAKAAKTTNPVNDDDEDDDEALVKILNAGSSVSHAGFLDAPLSGRETIFSVSHDEQMTLWRVPVEAADKRYNDNEDDGKDDTGEEDDETMAHGDVRPKLDCEYVIDVVTYGTEKVMGVGKHSAGRVDLIPIRTEMGLEDGMKGAIRLPGAHGEEIVRSFYVDTETDVIFTGGEDGIVRSWQAADEANDQEEATKTGPVRGKNKRQDSKAHLFRPY